MKKSSINFKKHFVPKKVKSTPNFMIEEQEKLFHIQQSSLESLSNLIKAHEINFFSANPFGNDEPFIIESLTILNKSLANSLNNQIYDRNELLKKNEKEIKKNFENNEKLKKLLSEITEIKDLNFRIENEIKRIEFFILESRCKLNELRQADCIREEDRDIFISSKSEIQTIEEELNVKLFILKKKLESLIEKEKKDNKDIETLNNQIKKFKDIFLFGKFDKKYIDTEAIIEEEDKTEDYSKSIINNNDSLIKRADTFNNSYSNKDNDKNLLTFNRIKRRNKSHKHKKNEIDNFIQSYHRNSWNVNINLNINLNHQSNGFVENEDLNLFMKNEYEKEKERNERKKSNNNVYNKTPPLQMDH